MKVCISIYCQSTYRCLRFLLNWLNGRRFIPWHLIVFFRLLQSIQLFPIRIHKGNIFGIVKRTTKEIARQVNFEQKDSVGGEGDVPSDDGNIFHEFVMGCNDYVESHLHAGYDLW